MNIINGKVIDEENLNKLSEADKKNYIEVKRDLSAKEIAAKQIALYAKCGCGSGKKFKFCCKKNEKS